jgi:hypothetical protein
MYLMRDYLQPTEPLDTPDLRYLNSSHGIIMQPLQRPLEIKLFYEQWFTGHLPTETPTFKPVYMHLPYDDSAPECQQGGG